ncbi:immunoglobulin-like domain-containing protein [Thermococcus thioreducens]|uniref:Bacterial Ig-like domain-containing protein n=1 Tax=Thermococcus thioreducens TaxID=277988 RepID=A0A1I0MH43_9EURY|nr:immunoglobulin-like domain-containing protein [Thermococcus thioreducens]ASJ12624.1 hypothetical protein A3L14_06860 [Thermococcus thioreducens]SEV87703.1 hypothetical protein SAMN05216170_0576 [Thermococcus thioreducens]
MRSTVLLGLFIFLTGITVALYAGPGVNTGSSPGEARAILELDKTVYKSGEDLILTIKNTGSETLLVGSFYRLYRLENGRWEELNIGFSFTGIGYTIPPGSNWSQTVPLVTHASDGAGKLEPLPPGRYRIMKTVSIDRGRCGGRSGEIILSEEFEVVG